MSKKQRKTCVTVVIEKNHEVKYILALSIHSFILQASENIAFQRSKCLINVQVLNKLLPIYKTLLSPN